MSKLCCFIVPFFGKLPLTMPYFLKTCEFNLNYNWIIFTDDRTPYSYPMNVQVKYCSFDDIVALCNDKFDYEIESQEGTFPDACIVTCLTIHQKSDRM